MGEFAAPEFERRRDLLEKALLQALVAPEVESIHKVRTSWRRLEAAVKLLPWLVATRRWDGFRIRMKAVMKVAAELRDRDNAMDRLHRFGPLCLAIQGQRRLWESEFHRCAEAMFPFALPLRKRFPPAAGENADAEAERILSDLEVKSQEERRKLGPTSQTEDWHRFRILTKRQRYSLEFFSALQEAYAAEALRVKDRQDILGAVEDVVAAIRVARAAIPKNKLIREPLDFLNAELKHTLAVLSEMP